MPGSRLTVTGQRPVVLYPDACLMWRVMRKAGVCSLEEDVFGGQFCIKDNQVYRFDPETGGLDVMLTVTRLQCDCANGRLNWT